MVHLWQTHFSKPSRNGYHNRQWADEMEAIGLMPSGTGQPGGKRTGQRVTHYIVERIASAKGGEAIKLCLNSRGRPWTRDGFSASFRKFLKRLEGEGKVRPGLTFHGLGHTVATVLAEAGVPDETIAAWLTHADVKMTRHYAKSAKRRRQLTAAVTSFEPVGKRRKRERRGNKFA